MTGTTKVQQRLTGLAGRYDGVIAEPATVGRSLEPVAARICGHVLGRLSDQRPTEQLCRRARSTTGASTGAPSTRLRAQHRSATAITRFSSLVETTIPAPVTFPGAPAPRFWEIEDAHLAYGLVPGARPTSPT